MTVMLGHARKVGSDSFWERRLRTRDGDALEAMSPSEGLDRINGPLLIVHGEEDAIVPFE